MERLRERLQTADKALARFAEAMAVDNPNDLERDATIQRFEFTFEALWKAAKLFLLVHEGIDTASPKSVIRACRESGVLTEQEARQALLMADDRNLTVHMYNEPLAVEIYGRLRLHYPLMCQWLAAMKAVYNQDIKE